MVFDPATGRIVEVREKTGEMLQVAKEITAWNNYKKELLKYKSNNAKYQAAR